MNFNHKLINRITGLSIYWLSLSIIGMFPYIISGEIPNIIDAFFESVSGFTTTGATIFTNIESHSKGILFWRSFTQWFGGLSIIIFAVILLPILEKLTPKVSDTIKIVFSIYITFTILETFFLLIGGLTFYDAIVHAFSTVSTGGFSPYGSPLSHFNSTYIHFVFAFFMIAGGISFNLYYSALRHGFRAFLRDSEFKFFMIILLISAFGIGANLLFTNTYGSTFDAIKYSAFQTISIVTTTGYTTVGFHSWPLFSKMILFSLMFMGACSASAGGGLKAVRVLMVFKLITRWISVMLHPNVFISIRLTDKTIPGETVSKAVNFVFLYVIIIFAGILLISLDNIDMMSCISAVVSSLGNIGPMLSETGPSVNYTIFSYPSRLLLSLLMLIGRLELFTLILLFVPRFWNPNR